MANYEFTFTIKDDDGNTFVKSVTAPTREQGLEQVGRQFVRRGTVTSITEFEREYTVERTEYKYADAPWDDGDSLEDVFENISGVSRVRYSDPYEGAYEPPTFYLTVIAGHPKDRVKQAVNDYFDGFELDEDGSSVVVRFGSPING